MTSRTLTPSDLDGGAAHNRFDHFQHVADLSPQARERVNTAAHEMLTHVAKVHDLQHGMQGKSEHLKTAEQYLDHKYKGRLESKEKELLKEFLSEHFKIKKEAANDDEYQKAA